jgi:phage FluMu protein Com
VSELVRGLLRCSRCELLLLEAGRCGMGTVREPRERATSGVESRYQATTGEDTAG